jgi:hypothetical protein
MPPRAVHLQYFTWSSNRSWREPAITLIDPSQPPGLASKKKVDRALPGQEDGHLKASMFGKRQRRHEDDEPLVPRGLIWQATDDTVAAETPQTETEFEKTNSTVAQLKMAPPPSRIATPASPVQLSAPKADSTSEKGPFWQKLPKVQMQKPLHEETGPANPPHASYPLTATVNGIPRPRLYSRVALHLAKRHLHWANEARRSFISAAHKVFDRVDLRAVVFKFRGRPDAASKRTKILLAQIQEDINNARIWEKSRSGLGSASNNFFAAIKNLSAAAQHGCNELKARAHAGFAAKTPKAQPQTTEAEPRLGSPELRPVTRQRVKSPLLIAAPGAVVKKILPWPETVRALRRDSRLWTSFAMAGVSALLVLGLISTVQHYGARALPSSTLHKTSAAACAPTEAATQAPHPIASRSPAGRSPNRTDSTLSKRTDPARVARPRGSHHNQDDDFVAPDTFVSYDNRRASSR